MTGELIAHDEWFVYTPDNGGATTTYKFMVAPRSALSNVSASPFAPKSVYGDRSYADYEAISAIAMTDFTGGMGQERFQDATQYYTSENVDTRGGSLVLAPLVNAVSKALAVNVTGESYKEIWADPALKATPAIQYTRVATRFPTPAAVSPYGDFLLRGVWLYLKADDWTPTVTVKIYDDHDTNHVPNTALLTTTIAPGTLSAYGKWTWVPFTTPAEIALTCNATYWISVENTSETKKVYWLRDATTGLGAAYYGSAWAQFGGEYAVWADDYRVRLAAPPTPFIGTGADGVSRVWVRSSSSLYYVGAAPSITAVPATYGGTTKRLDAAILSHAWYRSPAATKNWLYLALGDDVDMVRFNGDLGATLAWETVTGHKARCLCVHDNALVFANTRNQIDCFINDVWGTAPVEAGDSTYAVRNMVSWGGYVWVGKDDGLYRLTIPTGYPTTGTLVCQKIIDFLPMADADNFSMMLVHKGDLYFNIGNGLMYYTLSTSGSGLLTSIAPDTGLNLAASQRQTFRAGVSVLGALWLLAEGTVTPGATSESAVVGDSRLYCYTEGHWYAISEFAGVQLLPMRGICIEPGWYGEHPRLWFGQGWLMSYLQMPTTTLRRWLVPGVKFYDEGDWYSSWIDGNLRTVSKDWMRVELVISDSGTGANAGTNDTVSVYWRPDEATAWVQLGSSLAYNAGNTYVEFPANSHSHKCQLKVHLHGAGTLANPDTTTPRVEALILKYMERPSDIRSHTRTYRLADGLTNKAGGQGTRSLAQQLDDLRTLREAKEPLDWHAWYDETGTTRHVHVVNYQVSEAPTEELGTGAKGEMIAVVTLQEV